MKLSARSTQTGGFLTSLAIISLKKSATFFPEGYILRFPPTPSLSKKLLPALRALVNILLTHRQAALEAK
jgi:hypothetical protein